jgi:predicted esterase
VTGVILTSFRRHCFCFFILSRPQKTPVVVATMGIIIKSPSPLVWWLLLVDACIVSAWTWNNYSPRKISQKIDPHSSTTARRDLLFRIVTATTSATLLAAPQFGIAAATTPWTTERLKRVVDNQTYSALAYAPPTTILGDDDRNGDDNKTLPPLILVLHGAGRNDQDIFSELANPNGEHAGLIPSLIASGKAPPELLDNFAVLAPFSFGKQSFYEDSRSKLLRFVEWAASPEGRLAGCPKFDPRRIILFGFSDGATVAVELLTTRKFAAGVICAYGFTGKLPNEAVQRLANLPLWVFHCADDVIFDVKNSDRLVEKLSEANNSITGEGSFDLVKYSRYDRDQEGMPKRVRGHSTGITASRLPEVYKWMLQVPPVKI